ncbi:NAD(P)H-dependent oxidoreductase [Patescibacteria group bacterium]|nr:NAD(P)H-dependent oxidoreductase [Patescibacteria group bacterium]
MTNIKIILGSTRDNRVGDKVFNFVMEEASKNPNINVEGIDLKNYNIPFFNLEMNPAYMDNPGYSGDQVKLLKKIDEADGFIFVMPEYNHSYPGVLKNMIDTFYNEWRLKPVTFVSYGGISGGTRAVEQLRLVLIELQMVPIRSSVHIPFISAQINDNGFLKKETKEATHIDKTIEELEWWAKTLKEPRTNKLK